MGCSLQAQKQYIPSSFYQFNNSIQVFIQTSTKGNEGF